MTDRPPQERAILLLADLGRVMRARQDAAGDFASDNEELYYIELDAQIYARLRSLGDNSR